MIVKPAFLYPQSRQFPFDEVAEQIVRALEERSWRVPGIDVQFFQYEGGGRQRRMVSYVSGTDFALAFHRPQRRYGNWNDIAAVASIGIPRKQLCVESDESGPLLYVYVGGDWAIDKERFFVASKYNSRLKGEPRWYVLYRGSDDGQPVPPRHRRPVLLHKNNVHEYPPKGEEPKRFVTAEVFAEFTAWIKGNVLAKILEHPETDNEEAK